MTENFSVLMSLYYKEKAEYARECFDSLLRQTVKASEWVIVEDGPLTEELYSLLNEYEKKYPKLIKRVRLKNNMGLGLALREGILRCSNELIARMDTDDIARKDRFEKQLKVFRNHPNLDICGSYIVEFDGDINNIISKRKVPLCHTDILSYQRKRSAFNHVTVMFKRKAVINSGNYEDCPLMEDDMLWVKMLLNNCKCMNLEESLVYVRVGKDMYKRRGGLEYYKKYKKARKSIYETKYISKFDYVESLLVQLIVSIVPNVIRKKMFVFFLRSK